MVFGDVPSTVDRAVLKLLAAGWCFTSGCRGYSYSRRLKLQLLGNRKKVIRHKVVVAVVAVAVVVAVGSKVASG